MIIEDGNSKQTAKKLTKLIFPLKQVVNLKKLIKPNTFQI